MRTDTLGSRDVVQRRFICAIVKLNHSRRSGVLTRKDIEKEKVSICFC